MHEAVLVERFGANAFPEIDSFRLSMIAEVLYIRDLYSRAGREGQELSQADWEYVGELDELAHSEG